MLTADKIKSLPKNFQLDLLLLRLNPSLLNDKRVLQIFILLNNCNGPSDIRGRLKSEFDYPGLAAFYREKAASILANVPGSVTEVTVHLGPFYFGEYDMRKKAFPFSDVTGGKSAVDFDTVGLDSGPMVWPPWHVSSQRVIQAGQLRLLPDG